MTLDARVKCNKWWYAFCECKGSVAYFLTLHVKMNMHIMCYVHVRALYMKMWCNWAHKFHWDRLSVGRCILMYVCMWC